MEDTNLVDDFLCHFLYDSVFRVTWHGLAGSPALYHKINVPASGLIAHFGSVCRDSNIQKKVRDVSDGLGSTMALTNSHGLVKIGQR